MEFTEKKIWKKASAIGFAFSVACLLVCILQYHAESNANTFQKTVRLTMNFMALNLFFFLIFNPLNFHVYAVLFYAYGNGNFLDNGNILGSICIALSYLFLSTTGFFSKRKLLKSALFLSVPVFCLCVQAFHTGYVVFIISVMHIIGAGLIFYLAWLLLTPKIEKAKEIKTEKKISRSRFSERDIEFLERVLNGEKYSKIALMHNVSESTVKAQMIELYHYLGINSRTEFLTLFSGCRFTLED